MANTTTTTTAAAAAAATTSPATFFPGGYGGGGTSNFTFTLIGPPPPFPAPPRSVDLSPLKFILAVVAVIAVPALVYALFFAVPCPSDRRRRRSFSSSDELPTIAGDPAPPPAPPPVADVKFERESQSKENRNECPVCLSVFADGEEVRQLSACKHAFHASCIEMWLSDHSNCPVCRAAVNVKRQDGNVNGNGDVNANGNRNSGNRRVSVNSRVDDWHHGLPDASNLV